VAGEVLHPKTLLLVASPAQVGMASPLAISCIILLYPQAS
jgi:hypothetical protein